MSTQPATRPVPLEQEVARLRGLADAQRHAEAQVRARELLAQFPANRDLLLLGAICARHLGQVDQALATLAALDQAHPGFSLLHQERGLCHVVRKDAPAAIAALRQAVTINPALPLAWRMLEGVYRLTGDGDNAAIAAGQRATLAALPAPVVAATRAVCRRRPGTGRTDHPRLAAATRRSSRGDAPARQDRHGAQCDG